MSPFAGAALDAGAYLRDCARFAAHELGVFAALAQPSAVGELAATLGVGARRLSALLCVLALDGAVVRQGASWRRGEVPAVPGEPVREGWGRIAEVLRRDRPLARTEEAARFQAHLAERAVAPARELWTRIGAQGALLDAGGGVGVYATAWLDAGGTAATVVEAQEVVALAARSVGARVRLVSGDVRTAALGDVYDVALLSHVLHLHAPHDCAQIVERAVAALRPGGQVVVCELEVAADRTGPAAGVLFALNMALYTDGGDAYDAGQLIGWLGGAGVVDVHVERFASAPECVRVWGRRG